MTGPGARAGQRDAERRRRLAALDAADPGDDGERDEARDEQLVREVPPHHG